MNYKKYQTARNASWEILIDLNIQELPIHITSIFKKLNLPFHTYSETRNFIKQHNLESVATNSDGFTVLINNVHHVFYDETKPPNRKRFTLAHELGHIVCNHLLEHNNKGIYYTARNTEPSQNDTYEEHQANIFASRLLSPACVLHELKLLTTAQIAEACQISKQCASFRLERLLILEQRNQSFLNSKGYGCFYLDSKEKQVYKQFEKFITLHLK